MSDFIEQYQDILKWFRQYCPYTTVHLVGLPPQPSGRNKQFLIAANKHLGKMAKYWRSGYNWNVWYLPVQVIFFRNDNMFAQHNMPSKKGWFLARKEFLASLGLFSITPLYPGDPEPDWLKSFLQSQIQQ